MNSEEIIALVTGANRGIGFEIARQLARAGVRVILTARNSDNGAAAVEKLRKESLNTHFCFLDVTDTSSINKLRDFVDATFGRLDVLINNAGIILDGDGAGLTVPADAVSRTCATNSLGPLRVTQALVPLLRKSSDGRIINVSSGMGALNDMSGGYAAYRISKAALNAVTCIHAAELADARIAVNSMCPGWVKTDMGGPNAEREVAEGASTAIWLALEASRELTGKFVRDREIIPW